MSEQFYLRHNRTGMFVAATTPPRSASYKMPCANWKWVWKTEDATLFDEHSEIHPIIQMNVEGKVSRARSGEEQ